MMMNSNEIYKRGILEYIEKFHETAEKANFPDFPDEWGAKIVPLLDMYKPSLAVYIPYTKKRQKYLDFMENMGWSLIWKSEEREYGDRSFFVSYTFRSADHCEITLRFDPYDDKSECRIVPAGKADKKVDVYDFVCK